MNDWRPRVEAMAAGRPVPAPEVDDWITPDEPPQAATPAADDWITPFEPLSTPSSLPDAPGRVLESAIRGGVQGFKEGGVINLSPEEQQRARQEWGPIAYPLTTLGAGVDLAARAGAGLFRGAQAGVQQIFDEFGQPRLGRDVAAMPEAFMGGLPAAGVPQARLTRPNAPGAAGPRMLTGPDTPPPGGPGSAPGAPPGAPGAPRPSGPLPTTWSEVIRQANEERPPAAGADNLTPAQRQQAQSLNESLGLGQSEPPPTARPTETVLTTEEAPGGRQVQTQTQVLDAQTPPPPPTAPINSLAALDGVIAETERRRKYPNVQDADIAAALDQAIKDVMQKAPPGTPGMTPEGFMAKVRDTLEGLMIPISRAADLAARKTSLTNMLNDPRSNEEIAADIAAQQTAAVDDARSRLPEGFTIQEQPNGEWTLFDPAGDAVGSVLETPTQTVLDKWISDAEGLAQDVDWSDALREGDGTKESPVRVRQPNDIEAASSQVADPTPDQAEAGNYKQAHIKLHGLDIAIETRAGGERHGIDADGTPWTTVMPGDYGRIKRTKGADGDQVDVYLGPSAHEADKHPVWIVDQIDPKTGQFDEHKAMIGYPTREAAETAYRAGFSDGSGQSRMGAVSDMKWPQFIRWARRGNTTDPLRYQPPAAPPEGTPEPVQDMPGPAPTDTGIPISVEGPAGPAPLPTEPAPERLDQLMVEAELLEIELAGKGAPGTGDAWDEVQIPEEVEAQDQPISEWQKDNIQAVKDLLDKAPLIRAQIKYLHEEGMVAKEIAKVIGWDVDMVRTARDIIGLKPHGPAGGMAFGTMPGEDDGGQDGGSTRSGGDGDNGGEAVANEGKPPAGPETAGEGARSEPGRPAGDSGGRDAPVARPRTAADQERKPTVTAEPERGTGRDSDRGTAGASPSVSEPGEQGRPAVKTPEAAGAGLTKRAAKPEPKAPNASRWERIGRNLRGKPLFEDENGVRSFVEDNIRVTEAVQIRPDGTSTFNSADRGPDFTLSDKPDVGIIYPDGSEEPVASIAPEAVRKGWRRIGTNFYDKLLFEDERFVRSYMADGSRVIEPFTIDGPNGEVTIGNRSPEFMTVEEVENAGLAVQPESVDALAGVASEDGGGAAPEGDVEPDSATGEPAGGGTGGEADAGGSATVRGGGDRPAGPDPAAAGVGNEPGGVKAKAAPKKKGKGKAKVAEPLPAAEEPTAPIEEASPVNIPAIDFTIDNTLQLGRGTEGEKYRDNIAAIRTLKVIEEEGRRATPDEQRILARYVGWGGLKNAFRVAGSAADEGVAKGWEKRVAELEELLTAPELRAARASTRAAHYTSQDVVEAIWDGVQRLGFAGGAVLEPSVGTGNFLGLMPQELRGKSKVLAVEYDSLTARIAKQLYPNASVLHSGIQAVPLPRDYFSLAIGNPPFGNESLFFRYNRDVNQKTIHNQFFQASMDSVAEGGLLAMVVSHFLMDSADATNRLEMAWRAEFVDGIRLPDTAFKENARTEVVTDILFFRKRSAAEAADARTVVDAIRAGKAVKDGTFVHDRIRREIEGWTNAVPWRGAPGTESTFSVNEYFMRNPAMVIGKIDATGTMYGSGSALNVTLDDPAQFRPMLDRAIQRLPQVPARDRQANTSLASFEAMADAMRLAVDRVEVGAVTQAKDGTLKTVVSIDAGPGQPTLMREIPLTEHTPFNTDYSFNADGTWERTEDAVGEDGKPLKVVTEGRATKRNQKVTTKYDRAEDIPERHKWGSKRISMLKDMLPIRDLVKAQLTLEMQDSPVRMIEANRAKLNKAYDAFVKTHGLLHSSAVEKIAMTMPDGGLALSVEENVGTDKEPSYQKAAIMSRRVTSPPQRAEKAATPADAIAVSLSETGRLDMERITELLGEDAEKALTAGPNPLAFFDPEAERWETADAYLSGLVRRKLHAAEHAGLDANIKALKEVIPADWTAAQITPNLGSAWIPTDVYADFVKWLGYSIAHVQYVPLTNSFSVDAGGKPKPQWSTSGRAWEAGEIVERLLNSQSLKVTYRDQDDRTIVDEEATAESQAKGNEIFNEFLDWAYRDDDRRTRLVSIFNEKFNTRVLRQRDGSHLQLPGKVPDQIVKLRRHQVNAIWRGITDPVVLYDHVVGAGKTFVAIARIMERRRMGLTRKAMVVVPNHLVGQWAADVTKLYPAAKVLAATKADFERKNRRRLFARIGSGDFDMVIIGHSSFGFVDMDTATEERFLMEELQEAQDAIRAAQEQAAENGEGGRFRPFGVAEAERLAAKLETRLEKLREGKRDRLLTFEEMGIDDLTIDEAHEFKNLAYSSRLTGVSGMGNKTGSKKAMDLHLKLRSLRERPGSSVAFLTGTPISNSVAEMYLLLKNLAPRELKELGIDNFDAWRSMFVSYASAWEPTEAGGMKEVTRLGREWMNMRSLMDLYYSVTDAVTLQDLKAVFAEENPGKKFPVPDVLSMRQGKGDRLEQTIQPTPEQRRILRDIVAGFEELPQLDVRERAAQRFRLMDQGRKVSLDARAIDPSIQVKDGTGKIGAVVKNVARIYHEWDADKGTQIVFLDRSVPASKGDDKILKAYDDLAQKLEAAVLAGDEKAQSDIADSLATYNAADIAAMREAAAGGWNAYKEIKKQLVDQGIPEGEIRFIQEANTDEQKKAMFDLVKTGRVRVLIGSTPRLGAGTNVQDRLVGLHHVDVTWKPSDIEQREGRIIRQGNKLLEKYGDKFAVEIIAYATEMTTDAKMWSLNSGKLKAINGIRKYDGSFMMEFEDEEAASMAEMAARATGNPLMVERVTIAGDIQKLEIQQRGFQNAANAMRDELARDRRRVETGPADIALYEKFATAFDTGLAAAREATAKRGVTIEGKVYHSRVEAKAAADDAVAKQRGGEKNARYSIDVEGEKLTTEERIDRAIAQKLGTPDFEGSFNGKDYIDAYEMARTISDSITDIPTGRGNAKTVDGIVINGIRWEIDVYLSTFGKDRQVEYVFSAQSDTGRTVYSYSSDSKGAMATAAAIRGGISAMMTRMDQAGFSRMPDYFRRQMAEAEKNIPALEAQVSKPWPKADELAAKRARQAELTTLLSGMSFTTALNEQPIKISFSSRSMTTLDAAGDITSDVSSAFGDAMLSEASATAQDWTMVEGDAITPTDPAIYQASIEAVRKVVGPQGRVQIIPQKLTARGGMSTMAGADIGGFAMGGLMRVAETPRAERFRWNLHHESIHVLRNLGLFSAGEWKTLEAAAKRQGWIERFEVRKRYPNLPEDRQIEEAIAEAFAAASRADKDDPTGGVLGRAWQKTQRFLGAFRNALEGRGLRTAEGVFERTAAGRVGSRTTARMQPRGPQDQAEQDRRAAELERALTLPTDDGDVSLMAGMSPELRRMMVEAARRTKQATEDAVSRLWRGKEPPAGVSVEQPPEVRDISSLTAPFKTPALVFQHTELAPVIAAGIRAEELQSRWITRLVHRYDAIRKQLDDAGGSFDKVTEALWAGDADQVDIADDAARAELFDAWDLDDAEAEAFKAFHTLLEAQARLVDNHRRYMMPKVRAEKQRLIDALERIMDHARVPGAEAGRLYRRRATLTRRIARGKSKDPVADSAAIQAINAQLRAMRADDPDIQAKISDMQDNIDALEARLNASSVRGRVKGYVPHKFYGSWRLWVLGEVDPETGERERAEITSDQGFYNTREDAIDAAVAYKAKNPEADMLIAPKQIQWPVGIEGTTVSDAAFGRLARNLAMKAGLEGPALDAVLTDVARRQNRRRMYGPGMHREGVAGFARQMDRVMRTHIGQSVRYVTMDKLKFQAITAMENAGIGPYRLVTQERKALQRAFQSWLDDVMGRKQGFEETIDAALRRFPVPANVLLTGLVGAGLAGVAGVFGGAGTASPLISAVVGGYTGYQMFKSLTGKAVPWRAPEHYTDFPFRQFMSHMTTGMAHLLLGMVVNIKSALVNLMQTAVNTYPEIGLKYTLRGMNRAAQATWASMRGQATADTRLMERAGVQTLYRINEAGPVLAEHESRMAKFSMWAFQSAENINRSVAFFGAYARAMDAGRSPRDAFEDATRVVRDTQFHMGNANKPELLRQQWARMPGQFKNFLFQQIARLFSIPRSKVAKTVATMSVLGGALALPGFQIMDAGVKLLTGGWSPQSAIERTVLEYQAVGGWAANTATVFARGLPALYTDISQSVGMGVGFIPATGSDLSGPWWSKIGAQQEAAAKNAGLVDRLAALSPGLNALKALEAAANGMTIGSTGFMSALGDGKSAWTDWRRYGKTLYEPTNLQLLGAALNFTPPGVTALRSGMRQTAQTVEEYRRDRAAWMADIIQAVRNKDYPKAAKLIAKANGEGHPITPKLVSEAMKTANTPAMFRMLEDAPKALRPEVDKFRRGVEQQMGAPR